MVRVPELATPEADLRREGERIAQLIEELAMMGGIPVRQRAEELVGRLLHLYGAALAGLIEILGDDEIGETAKLRLASDPLVSSLLLLHGLHPDQALAAALDADVPPTAGPGEPGLGRRRPVM
jgi:hypothetical protein